MATIIEGDIFDNTREGYVMLVVNAKGRIRTDKRAFGFATKFARQYPDWYEDFKSEVTGHNADAVYGKINQLPVTDKLKALASISMYNPREGADVNLLVSHIYDGADMALQEGQSLTIPYGLGSHFGDLNWNKIYDRIKAIPNLIIVALPGILDEDEEEDEYEDEDEDDGLFDDEGDDEDGDFEQADELCKNEVEYSDEHWMNKKSDEDEPEQPEHVDPFEDSDDRD
jgi:AAA ATPase containing von Willebrand factor type A (vWA) domain